MDLAMRDIIEPAKPKSRRPGRRTMAGKVVEWVGCGKDTNAGEDN